MNQKMQNYSVESDNAEISIRHLAAYVIKKSRPTLLIVLACVVVALLISSAQWASKLSDPNYESPADVYDATITEYSDETLALETEISELEDKLDRELEYEQNSVLMQIDPYNKKYGTLTYYIDARESILSDNMEYLSDYNNSLLKTYMLYLSGGELYAQILERFPEYKNEQYIREVLSILRDDAANMITITVIGNEADTLAAILDIARSGMADMHTKATEQIGSHQLTEIRSNIYTVNDTALLDKQNGYREQIAATKQQVKDKQVELEELMPPDEVLPQQPIWLTITEQLIKTALLTLVGALIVIILLLALYYVVSNKVLDADKLQYSTKLDILGKIASDKSNRIRIWDKLAATVSGSRLQKAKREDLLALTAQSIRSTVRSMGIVEGNITLAGSVAPEELSGIAAAFNKALSDNKLVFTVAGDPMQEIASVEEINASVMAIVIVRQNASRCSDIVRQAARITAWGKPVLGAILLDADTV